MARSFKTNSGYRTFGVFSEPLDAGDYIYNKKARATFCVANNCTPAVNVGTQSNFLLFNRSNKLSVFPCKNVINKSNLNINLITQLNLLDVTVITDFSNNSAPISILPGTIDNFGTNLYLTYNVDPSGSLFGNTNCGSNNFVSYMEYAPNNSNKPFMK